MNAVAKVPHVEIDEQAETYLAEPEVGEELGLVHGLYSLDGLDLQDQGALDDQVDPQSALDRPRFCFPANPMSSGAER